MGWKPKWVQKAQTATSNAIKPITTSAPVKVVQKAVTPPPAPKVIQNIQKAANTIAKPVQKAVTQAPAKALQAVQKAAGNTTAPAAKSDSNVFEKLGDTLKQGAQWVGNTFTNIVAPGTANRTPTVKIAGDNPLEKDRIAKNPMKDFGPAGNPNKDFEQLQPMTSIPVLDDANVNPLARGIQRVKDSLKTPEQAPEARGLPEEGVLVAGNGVIPTKTTQSKNSIIQSIGDKLAQGADYLGGGIVSGIDKAGQVIDAGTEFFKQGTDSITVKGFTTQYGDVLTQRDMDRFREAEKRGDIAEMDRIRAEMKARQGE